MTFRDIFHKRSSFTIDHVNLQDITSAIEKTFQAVLSAILVFKH